MTAHYIAALGGYRLFYLLNWIVRAMTEDKYSAWLVWSAGFVQNLIYADFFYNYLRSMWNKKKMTLPTASSSSTSSSSSSDEPPAWFRSISKMVKKLITRNTRNQKPF